MFLYFDNYICIDVFNCILLSYNIYIFKLFLRFVYLYIENKWELVNVIYSSSVFKKE